MFLYCDRCLHPPVLCHSPPPPRFPPPRWRSCWRWRTTEKCPGPPGWTVPCNTSPNCTRSVSALTAVFPHEKSRSTLLKVQTAKKKKKNKNTSHLFLVAGNSGELGLDELSGLFSRVNWLLSRVFWVLGDTSRLEDVLVEEENIYFMYTGPVHAFSSTFILYYQVNRSLCGNMCKTFRSPLK